MRSAPKVILFIEAVRETGAVFCCAGSALIGRMPDRTPIILLVEDEPFTRLWIKRRLEEEGSSVSPAASGQEAVIYLRNGHIIETVVTDLGEGPNGWDVAQEARKARS